MQIIELYNRFRESSGINTDTRTLIKGQFFVALSGDNFDGNKYVDIAVQKGAHHVLCSDNQYGNQPNITVVKDTLETLQQLATYHRRQLKLPVVALTGSNGKTTTKELIISVLKEKYQVDGTRGNLNNHIGVPLTLLSFNDNTEVGVVEMGANHQGEITVLSAIAEPDYGLITNFGKAHLEGFGGIEGVKKGKSELYQFLRTHDKKAIVRKQDQEQLDRSHGIDRSLAPIFETLDVQPIKIKWEDTLIATQVTGSYNVANMELAAAVGLELGLTKRQIAAGLSNYLPQNNRSQLLTRASYTIIKDAYNANPTSMRAALYNLAQLPAPRIAIIGDMFELGTYAQEEHEAIVTLIQELQIEESYLVGENFFKTKGAAAHRFASYEDFEKHVKELKIKPQSHILLKGSRGMALERVLEII